MELMGGRALDRQAFGKPISQHGAFALAFANCRVELSAARLTVLDAASALDRFGNKKVAILNMLVTWMSGWQVFQPTCSSAVWPLSALHVLSYECKGKGPASCYGMGLTKQEYTFQQARDKIAAAKVLAPRAVLSVLDQAIQVHGGAGVSNDFPLARLWAGARTLRLADGPDEVHLLSIAKSELARLAEPSPKL